MTPALVLLDMQQGILLSEAIAWDDATAPGRAIQAAETMVRAARAAGRPVIHLGVSRPRNRGAFDALRTTVSSRSGRAPRDVLALAPGSAETEFVIPPLETEEIVHKMGVSGFQGSMLDPLLRNAGATRVIVAGAFTHMVVESTVRQGFDLGYRMIVARDGCCSPKTALHEHAMSATLPNFAEVLSSAQIIQALSGLAPATA